MPYSFEIHQDLIVGQFAGQRLLLDTGAPSSFAKTGIELMGKCYEVPSSFMGISLDALSDKLGSSIDGLLGADILAEYDFTIDWPAQQLIFSEALTEPSGQVVALDTAFGYPYVISLSCAGGDHTCYIDTGASVSFLDLEQTDGCEHLGIHVDFLPMMGDFTTDLYRCELTIGSDCLPANVGQLPDSLSLLLGMMGVEGILGADLFKACRVTFSPRRQQLFMQPYAAAHDSWSAHYDQVNQASFGQFLDSVTETTLDFIDELLPAQGVVLDAGAGTGRLSLPLAQAGFTVQAIDASAGMVAEHQRKRDEAGCDYPVSHCAVQEFRPDTTFDLALCLHTVTAYLSDEEQLQQAVKTFASALKPGGRVLIDFPFRELFRHSEYQAPGFRRIMDFEALEDRRYRYREKTFMQGDPGFEYTDSFLLRAWDRDEVVDAFKGNGMSLEEDLTEHFAGSGHHYLLFVKA